MEDNLDTSTFIEKILTNIKLTLLNSLEYYSNIGEPEICDNIAQALELCTELLTTDYYAKSEKYLENQNINNLNNWYNTWEVKRLFETRKKKNDLKKLFKIITKYSEG